MQQVKQSRDTDRVLVFSPSFLKKTDKNLDNIISLINDNFKCCTTAYEQRPKSPRDNKSPPIFLVKTV